MCSDDQVSCTAFDGTRQIASGPLAEVVSATKQAIDAGAAGPVLIFDDRSGRQVEIDFRGPAEQVLGRLRTFEKAEEPARGPGRPKLGVVAREVTLLPRHWEWLATQSGGASATLRRLVEEARRQSHGRDHARVAGEAVDRFMLAMTGNLPGHEEASRAFWRKEYARFSELTAMWPADVREHVRRLVAKAWDDNHVSD